MPVPYHTHIGLSPNTHYEVYAQFVCAADVTKPDIACYYYSGSDPVFVSWFWCSVLT